MNSQQAVFRQVFARRLKERRKSLGFTQSEVARQLFIEPQNVQRWETGIRVPMPETLVEMSNILDCSVDYLLGCTTNPKRNTTS